MSQRFLNTIADDPNDQMLEILDKHK